MKMTKIFRRRLFYFLLLFFLITGIGAVFYSQGWRIDFKTFAIKKTGAIYIQTKPKEVQIEIENILVKTQGGILQKGVLIDGLIPKIYKVNIKKEGYLPWQKKVEVKPDLVTELSQIILIPEHPLSLQLAFQKPIKDFWLIPNKKIVLKDDKESLYYFDYLKTKIQKLKGDNLINWDNEGKKIVTYDKQSGNFYLEDPVDSQAILNINLLFKNIWQREIKTSFSKVKIEDVILHPYKGGSLLLNTNQGIYMIDIEQLTVRLLTGEESPIKIYTSDLSNFYFADEKKLWAFNLIFKSQNLLAEIPTISKIAISDSHKYLAVLQKNGDLYLVQLSDSEKKPQKIANGIKDFSFSPDNKKFALWDQKGNLILYFLEEHYYRGLKKEKDVSNDLTNFPNLKKVAWYSDANHLIIQDDQTVYFLEIDNRPPINKFSLATNIKDFFYNSDEILFLKDDILSRLIL